MTTLDTGTDTVRAEIVDGVGVVTLNRPERRNALHPDMYKAVPVVLETFIGSDDVGAILLTAAGKAFCAGGDVRDGGGRKKPVEGEPVRRPSIEESTAGLVRQARMVELLHTSPKVTIAALPGAAIGAGLGIALSTDLRIAAASATLVPGWPQLGFSGDFGGPWFLTRLVGPSKALELFVDNTSLDAQAALALGLVNKVVPDEQLQHEALAWARRIAAGPRSAWTLFKDNVRQAQVLSLSEALPGESERMVRSGLTEDHRAAVKRWLVAAAAKKQVSS
jgi:2-(1,2-epoxy-1,2-dihydrophenyl)acetyl-CoA isomerase